MNLANECRNKFNYLIKLAKETNCAVVIIGHLNKAQGMKAINRTNGSMDIVGAVRSALIIAKTDEKNKPNERVLVMQKSNLAPTGKAIIFSVDNGVVIWSEEVEKTADEILNSSDGAGRPDNQTQNAIEMLTDILSENPMLQREIIQEMNKRGISERTVRKAKSILGVQSIKRGNNWYWFLEN